MSTLVIALLSSALVAVTAICLIYQRRLKELLRLSKDREELVLAAEHRLFVFLHDLGEALNRDSRREVINRLIVEGALKVTDSAAGALYLLDESRENLVPKFYSDACSPVVALPERIVAKGRSDPAALQSFLRLHRVKTDSGVLGEVFTRQAAEVVANLKREPRLGSSNNPLHHATAAMFCPLTSGGRQLGVLVVTAPKDRPGFDQNDFDLFRSLAEQAAYAMANALVREEARAMQQVDAELRAAGEIQRILMPDHEPELPGYQVAGRNLPARVLSGDFYDYVPLPDGRLALVIADVSGKGTAAALISAMCRSVMRCVAPSLRSPSAILAEINRQLYPDIREDMFVTMTCAVADPAAHTVTIARAGHNDPMLLRAASGGVERPQVPGIAIGIDAGAVFERNNNELEIRMEPGDCLLLFTDGVNEATDSKELMFGEERTARILAGHAARGPRHVIGELMREIDQFIGGHRSLDDITLIALQRCA
jgi:sigma-B regulation protein RsbU (phosphoserine phosphatase)